MAKRGKPKREHIILACTVCKHRGYITQKNKQNTPDRLTIMKYCAKCRKHTEHKETR